MSNNEQGLGIVADYLRAVGKRYESNALFRGHANRTWKPIPSAFRDGADGLVTTDQLQRWKMMAQRLAKMPDELHWLVLAQHFGIPTPLLDWTMNPLTALYFACENSEGSDEGVVIFVPRESFEFAEHTLTVDPLRDDRTRPMLFDTSAMNVRSSAQDSYMTLHPRDPSPGFEFGEAFVLDKKMKWLARIGLRILGLSPERIYPDLAVAAREMRSWLEIDHLLGPSNTGKRPWY